jgi:hypothetical protein
MSSYASRLAIFDGQNRQTTARPAANPEHPEHQEHQEHQESGTGEEAGRRQIAQFKKSHALNGVFLFWLL